MKSIRVPSQRSHAALAAHHAKRRRSTSVVAKIWVVLLAGVLTIEAGCSRSDRNSSEELGVARLFDAPERLAIESEFTAPGSLDDLFARAEPILDKTIAECPSSISAAIDAPWADELLGFDAGVAGTPTGSARLQLLVVATKTLRTHLLAIALERDLLPNETAIAFEYNAVFDPTILASAERIESMLRAHATFLRRLGVDDRFTTEDRTRSLLLEPTKVSGAIVIGIITHSQPLAASRVRIGRLDHRIGWLMASPSALADPANPLLRPETIGPVTRRSLVVAGNARVKTRAKVPSGTATFRMHLALLFQSGALPLDLHLSFIPNDGSPPIVRDVKSRADSSRWIPVEVDVSALAERDVEIEIALRSDSKRSESMLLLAEPLIEGRAGQTLPDVIVISLDTTRADRTSVYGNPRRTTPNLETLAKSSVVFDTAIAPAPWTLPSHVSLFSGMYPDRHGVHGPKSIVATATPWLPQLMARRGYQTLAFTGGGYVNPEFGFARGFERYAITDPGYPTSAWAQSRNDRAAFDLAQNTTEARSEILSELRRKRERPLFLFVHTYASHNYSPPPATLEEFGVAKERVSQVLAMQPTSDRSLSNHGAALPPTERDQKYEDARALYDGAVRTADDLVGAILDELRRSDRLANTIVLVVADHGEELGERGNFGHGQSVFDEMIRIPMLWHVPQKAARRVADVVSLIDVMPTLVELLALDPKHDFGPGAFDGRSLNSLLDGGARESLPALSRGNRRDTIFRSLRGKRDKIIETRTPGSDVERSLYSLADDPGEARDLARERGEDVEKLGGVLDRTVESLRSRGQGSSDRAISSELEDRLRQLGYLGGDGG